MVFPYKLPGRPRECLGENAMRPRILGEKGEKLTQWPTRCKVRKILPGSIVSHPRKPHLVALARSARVAALMLRAHNRTSDLAMHLAGELIGFGCWLREWADYAPCASVDKMRAENLQAVAGFVAARAQELRS